MSSTSSTSSASTSLFNGTSRYSSDFQAVINRSVAIASLPLTALESQKTELGNQQTELSGLIKKFSALQTAADQVAAAVGGASFESSVSDDSKVTVALTDGAAEGNYSVTVVDPGAYATSLSTAKWTADQSQTHTYAISLSGESRTIYPADDSAASVAAAINLGYGDQVRAIVVNVGSTETPDYRVSLQATKLGNLQPDLLRDSVSLQTQQTQGTMAKYMVNQSGQTVSSSSRSVRIANGVTVNLLTGSASPVNITITRSSSALSSALDAFTTAFNAAVDEVDSQHGTSAGALAGQSLVNSLSTVLSGISTYQSGASGLSGLQDLGLDLDKTGHLSFDSFSLLAADLTNSAGVTAFLGSSTSGGFLKSVANSLKSVSDSSTGLLTQASNGLASQESALDTQISTHQEAIDRLTERLAAQMAASDALIASMEQQYNYLSQLFTAQQDASKLYG
jgi:flagellar hook-associated protein 2